MADVPETILWIEKIEDPSAGPPLKDGMIEGTMSRIRDGKAVAQVGTTPTIFVTKAMLRAGAEAMAQVMSNMDDPTDEEPLLSKMYRAMEEAKHHG